MIVDAFNVKKSYSQLQVLKGVHLKVEPGEIIAIVGPSGAGKSTLLHILGGLDVPQEGSVMLDGQDLYNLSENSRARLRNERIGFVFQFYHLLPELTALENVILPLMIRDDRRSKKELLAKGEGMLQRVGLEKRVQHKPKELSGGEQQRVAIARALINEPKIVFCDEPTGNLDSATGRQIIDLLFQLNREKQQTLILVTHDEEISRLSHRVLHMKDGQLLAK